MGLARHVIETARLRLVSMGPGFLRASLLGGPAPAEAILGAELPCDWPSPRPLFELRLRQLERDPERDPELEPWLTRALVLTCGNRVVGVSGFHGPPGGAWLKEYAPDGVEFGYTVFEDHRRMGMYRGIATHFKRPVGNGNALKRVETSL